MGDQSDIQWVDAGDGTGRKIPRIDIHPATQVAEMSDADVFGPPAAQGAPTTAPTNIDASATAAPPAAPMPLAQAAPQEMSDDQVFGPQQRSPAAELGRQAAGLPARYAIEGLTSVPAMVGDATNAAINLGSKGINAVAGTKIPMLGMPSQGISDVLTKAGLPNPENPTERVVGDVSKAIASVPAFAETAAASGYKALRPLTENLGQQLTSSIGASAGAGVARENGAPWYVQMLAGLGGGAAGSLRTAPNAAATARADTFNKAGVAPSVADARQSPFWQWVQKAVNAVPMADNVVANNEQARVGQAQQSTQDIAAGSGTPKSPYDLGNEVQHGVSRYVNDKPIYGAVNKGLAPDEYYDAEGSFLQKLKDNAANLFGEARAKNKFFYAKDAPELNEILRTPNGRAALNQAMTEAANLRQPFGLARGSDGKMMTAEDFDKGEQITALTFDAADAIRRAYGAVIKNSSNPLTGGSANAGRIARIGQDEFIDAIAKGDKSGSWKAAVQNYAGDAEVLQSLRDGREFMSMDPEQISQRLKDSSFAERDAFQSGAARAIRDKLYAGSDSADPTKSIFGNDLIRDKMRAVFPNDKAYKAFEETITRVDKNLRGIFNAKSPEDAYQQIMTASKGNGNYTKLVMLRRALNDKEWGNLASSIVSKLGKPNPGEIVTPDMPQFSVSKFVTDYNKITPDAKALLFDGAKEGELRESLDRLARALAFMKGAEKYANHSNSGNLAGHGAMYSAAAASSGAAAMGHWLPALGVAGTLLAANLTARAMYNPTFVKLMTRTIIASPTTRPQLALQIARFASENPALANDSRELIKAMVPVGAQPDQNGQSK